MNMFTQFRSGANFFSCSGVSTYGNAASSSGILYTPIHSERMSPGRQAACTSFGFIDKIKLRMGSDERRTNFLLLANLRISRSLSLTLSLSLLGGMSLSKAKYRCLGFDSLALRLYEWSLARELTKHADVIEGNATRKTNSPKIATNLHRVLHNEQDAVFNDRDGDM